jgi:multidrug resistance efflux pump
VGLAGAIGVFFKKIGSFFSSSTADKLEEKNEAVKADLARLKEQVAAFETDLKRERELHQREMAVIRKEIDQKEQAVAQARGQVERMRTMTPEEYVKSLTDQERSRYEDEINKDVWVFGEGPEHGGKP